MAAAPTPANKLESLLHELIPISRAMGIRVAHLDADSLCLEAPLALNHNHAGSGFAGSLYSLASLTGWAFLRQLVDREGVAAELLLAEANVRYRRPVTADLRAWVRVDAAEQARLLEALRAGRKARLPLEIVLPEPADPAVTFAGSYFARPISR